MDFEACHREALRIRDTAIAKAGAEKIERGELPPKENFKRSKRLAEIAEESANFEQRVQEGGQIEPRESRLSFQTMTRLGRAKVQTICLNE